MMAASADQTKLSVSDIGGSRPVPDPTALTTDQLRREISTLRELIEARLDGYDKANALIHHEMEKLPHMREAAVANLQELHDEKFKSIAALLETRFDGISTQFQERDKRTEQLSLSDKTAIAAALQAQKEAAGATNESNSIAISKMEANFNKLIDQLAVAFASGIKNMDEKINDVKTRQDRGDGRTSVSEPTTSEALRMLTASNHDLGRSRDAAKGANDNSTWIIAFTISAISLLIAAGALIFTIAK